MSRWNNPGVRRPDQHLLSRSGLHAVWRRGLRAATALGSVFAISSFANADEADVWVTSVTAPVITVESNGARYDGVSSPAVNIEGHMRVVIDAHVFGRVESWEAYPVLKLTGSPLHASFQDRGDARIYEDPLPKRVNKSARFILTKSDYESEAEWACGQHAQTLRGQGLSNTEIYGQDRAVQLEVRAKLKYSMTGASGTPLPPEVRATPEPSITVNCKGHEPVVSSSLSILEEDSHSERCTLNLQVAFATTRPDEPVRFRFVDDTGKQSNAMTARTRADKSTSFSVPYTASGGRRSGQIRVSFFGEPLPRSGR